jgi:hypothetical protein
MFKKVILVFCLFITWLFPNHLKSQDCEYEKNEIDAVTEVNIKLTIPVVLARLNNNPLYFKAQSIGKHKFLKMRYYKYNDFYIQEDREIAFKLTNGEEVTLFPRPTPVDTTSMSDFVTISSLLIYRLDADQFEKLKTYPVTTFKYYLVSGFIEMDIKDSRQIRLMEILKCIE